MRTPFLIALIISLVLGTTYWYQSTKYQCPVPLSYRIGLIADGFALTDAEAQAHVATAAAVWEDGTGRDLFYYDPESPFAVNFIFDDRQLLANAQAAKLNELDSTEAANEALIADIASLEQSLAQSRARYEERVETYNRDLVAYNADVTRYNDRGGAPEDVFAELEARRESLDARAATLSALQDDINELLRERDRLVARANREIENYNQRVADFNEQFADGREFTQGDYQGDRINIYKFSDTVELETVLAHEFGHALGIGHVEGEDSLMYYLMTERNRVPELSVFDQAAFDDVCGSGTEWDHQLRRGIRGLLRSVGF